MAGSGSAFDGRGLILPPWPPGTDPDVVARWAILEDYLSQRTRVKAYIDEFDNPNPSPAFPFYSQPMFWTAVDEDTSKLWDGGSDFIITKQTAGDYLFDVTYGALGGSLTSYSQGFIEIEGKDGAKRYPGRSADALATSGGTFIGWDNVVDGDKIRVVYNANEYYVAYGSLRILRHI